MAMNKKEQAAFDNMTVAMIRNRALRWSDYDAEPDLPVPDPSDGLVNGWTINVYSASVRKTWSSCVTHGDGHSVDGKRPPHASQNGIRQFSTKIRALKALRRALEFQFADKLAIIDRLIIESDGGEQ